MFALLWRPLFCEVLVGGWVRNACPALAVPFLEEAIEEAKKTTCS